MEVINFKKTGTDKMMNSVVQQGVKVTTYVCFDQLCILFYHHQRLFKMFFRYVSDGSLSITQHFC